MAAKREKRSNAGSHMAKLLNAMDEDEVYKSLYGGFEEIEDDNEIRYSSDESASDSEDSDISLSENDDVISDDETEVKTKKKNVYRDKKAVERKSGVKRRAEIPAAGICARPVPSAVIDQGNVISKSRRSTRSAAGGGLEQSKTSPISSNGDGSDVKMPPPFSKPVKERSASTCPPSSEYRKLTQEELLEEAKTTEQINLASLEKFYELRRMQKKSNTRVKRHRVVGGSTFYSRDGISIITYRDKASYDEAFPPRPTVRPPRKTCVISGLPAKYFDPLSKKPYANLEAYKELRRLYNKPKET